MIEFDPALPRLVLCFCASCGYFLIEAADQLWSELLLRTTKEHHPSSPFRASENVGSDAIRASQAEATTKHKRVINGY